MDPVALARFATLGRVLLWAAALVLGLSVIAAIAIAGSQTSIPLAEEVQREGRGFFVLFTLAGGITGAGVLAGLGAIVTLLAARRAEDAP